MNTYPSLPFISVQITISIFYNAGLLKLFTCNFHNEHHGLHPSNLAYEFE